MTKDAIEAHKEDAPEYDRQALEWGWNPGVFLGMMWEHVKPGQRLLDTGIGTGLASAPFRKLGIEVHGFDGAQQMLDICRAKGFAADLRRHDIADRPWPYEDGAFDCAICSGVFHFFGDLAPTFAETARVLAPGGVYGFTCSNGSSPVDDDPDGYARQLDAASEVKIYVHGSGYVASALDAAGLDLLRKLVFLASKNPETGAEHYGTLYVARKR
jgi:predicted TPR repeat methyltransferase